MLSLILSHKLTKIALPIMLAFAFLVMFSATATLAAPAPDTTQVQIVLDAAPVMPENTLMTFLATPTTTLQINTDAYLDYVFQYANLIIDALLLISAIKAGVGFGLKLLGQLGSIFGG